MIVVPLVTCNVTAARWASADRTVMVLDTTDRGAVMFSQIDRPETWAAMIAQTTVPIADYVDPNPPPRANGGPDVGA
jgi:galactitol-specific phosphotransferase system IIC component